MTKVNQDSALTLTTTLRETRLTATNAELQIFEDNVLDGVVEDARNFATLTYAGLKGLDRLSYALTGKSFGQLAPDQQKRMRAMQGDITVGKMSPRVVAAGSDRKDRLMTGTDGAFVPGGAGRDGTILIRSGMTPSAQRRTGREEFGEAIAQRAKDRGIDVASGDVGARFEADQRGETVSLKATPAAFEASESDTTHVWLDGRNVAAHARSRPNEHAGFALRSGRSLVEFVKGALNAEMSRTGDMAPKPKTRKVYATIKFEGRDEIMVEQYDPVSKKWVQVAHKKAGIIQEPTVVRMNAPDGAKPKTRIRNVSQGGHVVESSDKRNTKSTRTTDSFEDRPKGTRGSSRKTHDRDDVVIAYRTTRPTVLDKPVLHKKYAADHRFYRDPKNECTDMAIVTLEDGDGYGFKKFQVQDEKGKWVTVSERSSAGWSAKGGKREEEITVDIPYNKKDGQPKMRFVTTKGDHVPVGKGKKHNDDWETTKDGYTTQIDLPNNYNPFSGSMGGNHTYVSYKSRTLKMDTPDIKGPGDFEEANPGTFGGSVFAAIGVDYERKATGQFVVETLNDLGYTFDPKGSGIDNDLAGYLLTGLARGPATGATIDSLIDRGVLVVNLKTGKITVDTSKMTETDALSIVASVIVADIPPTKKRALLQKLGLTPADQREIEGHLGNDDGVLNHTDFVDEGAADHDGTLPYAARISGKGVLAGIASALTGMFYFGLKAEKIIQRNDAPFRDPPFPNIPYATGSSSSGVDPAEAGLMINAHLGRDATHRDMGDLIDDGKVTAITNPEGDVVAYRVNVGAFSEEELNGIVANVLDGNDGNSRSAEEDLALLGLSPRDIAVLKSVYFGVREPVTGASIRSKGDKDMFNIGANGKLSVNLGREFEVDRRDKDAIPQKESRWPKAEDPKLPTGDTAVDVYPRYTQPNLFENWKVGDKEIVPHRGRFDNGRGIPENSLASIDAAVGLDSETGRHNSYSVEIDVMSTKDGTMVLSHDQGTARSTTLGNEPIGELGADEVVGRPIIIREVKDGKFTGEYVVTEEPVVTMETAIEYAVSINPDVTIIMDARGKDPGQVAAEVSKLPPHLRKHVAIQTYPYDYNSGKEFVDDARAKGAVEGWEEDIQIIPVLPAPLTKKLAQEKFGLSSDQEPTYEQRVEAGLEWVKSFADEGVDVVGHSIQVDGTGDFYDKESDAIDGGFTDKEKRDQRIKSDFRGDAANIEIGKRLKTDEPTIPWINSYRADDYKSGGQYYIYAFKDGEPTLKPNGAAGEGSKNRATPGALTDYYDVVITDRPYEEKAVLVDREDNNEELDHERDFPAIVVPDRKE